MITVRIPNNFLPERSYIVRTLLRHYMGIDVEIIPDENIHQYELHWNQKTIVIHDVFFGSIPDGQSCYGSQYIPGHIQQASHELAEILMLYGSGELHKSPDKIECHADLFGGAFFMLTRWEESLGLYFDAHYRFPASEALAVKNDSIRRPIVDEYVALLRQWLLSFHYPLPPDPYDYKVIPTCDVDIPFYYSGKPLWKILGSRLKQHWNPFRLLAEYNTYTAVQKGSLHDPYYQFNYLMSLAEKNGTSFYFNFIGGGHTEFEGYYDASDFRITSLMQEIISRGHHVGLHPSYNAYNDLDAMREEKQVIETGASMPVTTSRQHYLRFAVPDTWQKLSTAGLQEDSTMGYAAEPGFRCGTCKPFPVFDIHQRQTLPLMERPLLIMEFSLRRYKNLSVDQSLQVCDEIKSQVKKHRGEFIFLWHNSSLSEIDGWDKWKPVLEALMQ